MKWTLESFSFAILLKKSLVIFKDLTISSILEGNINVKFSPSNRGVESMPIWRACRQPPLRLLYHS